jgi:hypothetical protein
MRKLHELVAKWLNKPTFKLEDEPGFEEDRDKLLHYRLELQLNPRIKALQEQILNDEKEKWERYPQYTLEDDPELNLFRDELKIFCQGKMAEWAFQLDVNLLDNIYRTFLDVVARFHIKSKEEKIKILQMYKDIDLSIIKHNVPAMETYKAEIARWVKAMEKELRHE